MRAITEQHDGLRIERIVDRGEIAAIFPKGGDGRRKSSSHEFTPADHCFDICDWDVAEILTPSAFGRGHCLGNAMSYVLEHGGVVVLGRLADHDKGTVCRHAWVQSPDGKHMDWRGAGDYTYRVDGTMELFVR